MASSNTIEIPPESETLIPGYLIGESGPPIVGILEPTYDFLETHNLLMAKTLMDSENKNVFIRVFNITQETICVHKETTVGELSPVAEIKSVNSQTLRCNVKSKVQELQYLHCKYTLNLNMLKEHGTLL